MTTVATCYIGLGSNLGERGQNIKEAIQALSAEKDIKVVKVSSIEESSPLEGSHGDNYLNAAVKIETSLSCEQLLKAVTGIEDKLGRTRDRKWDSRTIDLDILLYEDDIINTNGLTIPHAQMHLRSFVLNGMCELAADIVHPVLKRTMQELANRLNSGNFLLQPDRPQNISVGGVIGVGKTTLANGLAQKFGCKMIAEAYDTNPYLAEVYSGRAELALESQLFFLESRVEQLNKDSLSRGKIVVTDYIFEKEIIFAKQTLSERQLEEYNKKHDELKGKVAEPVLVVYLEGSAQVCLDRITKRNRPYEQEIELDSLKNFIDDYEDLFAGWKKSPVIRLDVQEFNCLKDDHVKNIAKEIESYVWNWPRQ